MLDRGDNNGAFCSRTAIDRGESSMDAETLLYFLPENAFTVSRARASQGEKSREAQFTGRKSAFRRSFQHPVADAQQTDKTSRRMAGNGQAIQRSSGQEHLTPDQQHSSSRQITVPETETTPSTGIHDVSLPHQTHVASLLLSGRCFTPYPPTCAVCNFTTSGRFTEVPSVGQNAGDITS